MIAGDFVSDPSAAARGCRDSRSLVEAFVSSMTPSVLAIMYDVTSYMNPKKGAVYMNGTGRERENGMKDGKKTRLAFYD